MENEKKMTKKSTKRLIPFMEFNIYEGMNFNGPNQFSVLTFYFLHMKYHFSDLRIKNLQLNHFDIDCDHSLVRRLHNEVDIIRECLQNFFRKNPQIDFYITFQETFQSIKSENSVLNFSSII